MDHPDIIYSISILLNSKSLAMFSNTNKLIYDISNKVYERRTIYDHVLSMVLIQDISYLYMLKAPIVFQESYKGYYRPRLPYDTSTNYQTYQKDNIRICFEDYIYVRINHKQFLTLEVNILMKLLISN